MELTSIKLYSYNIDDTAVFAIDQQCFKLETLHIMSDKSRAGLPY